MRVPTLLPVAVAMAGAGSAWAQAPAEVANLRLDDPATLVWDAAGGADHYNVYRGRVADLAIGAPRCHGFEIAGTTFSSPETPAPGDAFAYLVTGESLANGEGTPGAPSAGGDRPLLGRCRTVMRNHVLNRIGAGWDEWTRDRIETLGFDAYIDEQLAPVSIVENPEYGTAVAPYKPPEDIIELIATLTVGHVYSRKQLEWELASFWSNHFNTFWGKTAQIFNGVYPECQAAGVPPQCDPLYPAVSYSVSSELTVGDENNYKYLALNGNFLDMLLRNTRSVPMIIFLDTYTSVVGNPNENYPRELMELYSMGVDAGYTQADVEELSRVFTGWTACKKEIANLDDPLGPCITNYWEPAPQGRWAAHFVLGNHDCTEKTLFAGTPYEATIPDTCGNPADGLDDVELALGAIVAHPATAEFMSRKLLQWFVTDDPPQTLIDDIVAEWNDDANPQGVGDLKEVLRAILHHPAFLDPDLVGSKIKTPLEQIASAIRAIGGHTDGIDWTLNTLVNAQHIPYYNEVPTGWSELGEDWIGTNNTLERQNFAIALTFLDEPAFGSDPGAFLAAHGVSTAPGNAAAIVEFFADTMFGGALTPAEKQLAIDYLETDDVGAPDPAYDDGRIRQLVAFLLGYPQFQEQ